MFFYVHETGALFVPALQEGKSKTLEVLIAKEEAHRFIDRMFKEMKAAWNVQNEQLKKEVNEKWNKK